MIDVHNKKVTDGSFKALDVTKVAMKNLSLKTFFEKFENIHYDIIHTEEAETKLIKPFSKYITKYYIHEFKYENNEKEFYYIVETEDFYNFNTSQPFHKLFVFVLNADFTPKYSYIFNYNKMNRELHNREYALENDIYFVENIIKCDYKDKHKIPFYDTFIDRVEKNIFLILDNDTPKYKTIRNVFENKYYVKLDEKLFIYNWKENTPKLKHISDLDKLRNNAIQSIPRQIECGRLYKIIDDHKLVPIQYNLNGYIVDVFTSTNGYSGIILVNIYLDKAYLPTSTTYLIDMNDFMRSMDRFEENIFKVINDFCILIFSSIDKRSFTNNIFKFDVEYVNRPERDPNFVSSMMNLSYNFENHLSSK